MERQSQLLRHRLDHSADDGEVHSAQRQKMRYPGARHVAFQDAESALIRQKQSLYHRAGLIARVNVSDSTDTCAQFLDLCPECRAPTRMADLTDRLAGESDSVGTEIIFVESDVRVDLVEFDEYHVAVDFVADRERVRAFAQEQSCRGFSFAAKLGKTDFVGRVPVRLGTDSGNHRFYTRNALPGGEPFEWGYSEIIKRDRGQQL